MNGVLSESERLTRSLTALRHAVLRDGFLDAIRAMDDHELSVAQMATLMLLEAEGSSTVGDLANDLGRSLSATSRLLDQMVRRDLISRQEAEHDRRVQRRRAEAQLAVMASLSDAERADVMRAMALLAEAATRRRAADGTAPNEARPAANTE